MIRPEEIRRKAENLYPEFLCSWLAGEPFFPRTIPANRQLDPLDHSGAIAALRALREESKDLLGFGYRVHWRERRSRAFGRNPFPERFVFETQDDFLRYLDKQTQFASFTSAVEKLRAEFPALNGWVRSHRQLLIELEPELDGLMHVLRYFQEHPRPACFARELPVPVDTKFLERHERVFREWFDLVLRPETIRSDETHFARRYGLRYAEIHVIVRLLDQALLTELDCRWLEFSLPISALAKLPVRDVHVLIVENKINLLTLPARPRTIGLGALGYAVTELRAVSWLTVNPITYWGDVDVEGFEILSLLRAEFPQARSILMGEATLIQHQLWTVTGKGRTITTLPRLEVQELRAFERCRDENLRLEQERIPISELIPALDSP